MRTPRLQLAAEQPLIEECWIPPKKDTPCLRETFKENLNYPGNHDGVISHLDPEILAYEVKWALGSITMNKTCGGDGIPAELFQQDSRRGKNLIQNQTSDLPETLRGGEPNLVCTRTQGPHKT